jgi:hypothetical protein
MFSSFGLGAAAGPPPIKAQHEPERCHSCAAIQDAQTPNQTSASTPIHFTGLFQAVRNNEET